MIVSFPPEVELYRYTSVVSEPLYRVKDDNISPYTGFQPRYNPKLKGPPMVFPAFAAPSRTSGTHRTKMTVNGWEAYLRKLNGDKFKAAVANHLAMFNGPDEWPEGDKMESLIFGCNLVRAVESEVDGWARLITLNYNAGPPAGMPTYEENPVYVQKFTMIWRDGAITSRVPELYYPVVSKYPVFMPWSWLEIVSPEMMTQPPP